MDRLSATLAAILQVSLVLAVFGGMAAAVLPTVA